LRREALQVLGDVLVEARLLELDGELAGGDAARAQEQRWRGEEQPRGDPAGERPVPRCRRAVRRFAPFLVLALACVLAAAAGPPGFGALCYVRTAVLGGELWRLLSTHLVHAGAAHLLWNLAGLALVALAVGREL